MKLHQMANDGQQLDETVAPHERYFGPATEEEESLLVGVSPDHPNYRKILLSIRRTKRLSPAFYQRMLNHD